MHSLSRLFYNAGFRVQYEDDADFEKNRLDKGLHASKTKVYKGTLNTLSRARLRLKDAKEVAIKTFCSNNPTIKAAIPSTYAEFIENCRQDISFSASEIVYEKAVYEKVSHIPELENNIIKYVTYVRVPLDPVQYQNYVLSDPDNIYKKQFETKQVNDFTSLADLYMPDPGQLEVGRESIAKKYIRPDFFYLNMLVTEYTPGQSLYSLIKETSKPLEDDFILPILFQIVWGIQVLQNHGIEHNDMHEGNVFIVLDTPDTMDRHHTANNGDIFVMPNNSPRVLFFDWDFANMTSQVSQKASNPYYCERHGICGVLNERRDIYRAMFKFIFEQRSYMPRSAKDFLDAVLNGPVGRQNLDYVRVRDKSGQLTGIDNSYPCNVKPGEPDRCMPYLPDEPKQIQDCATLLAHPSFRRYLFGQNKSTMTVVSDYFQKFKKDAYDLAEMLSE